MAGRKLVRVLMQWEDGETQTLDGDAADKWLREMNGVIAYQFARNPHSQVVSAHPWNHCIPAKQKA